MVSNHAFLIQVHTQPELFDRILSRLESPTHYFFINIDAKSKYYNEFHKVINKHSNVISITHNNVMHGGYSQIDCTIRQLKAAISSEIEFQYFHSISGQDYPCVSNHCFDRFFLNNKKSFMLCDTEEEALQRRTGPYKERLEHWYFMDVFNGNIARRLHIAGILRVLLYVIPRPLKFMNRIYGGWNWFSLHLDAVKYLLRFIDYNPSYLNRFRYTLCADEIVYSTVLYPEREKLLLQTRNSLRYVEWFPKRVYSSLPLILEESEFVDIINSGAFFCRKVDIHQSEKLLDMIDAYCARQG